MADTRLIIRKALHNDVAGLVEMAANAFRDTYREIVDPQDMEAYVTTALTSDYFVPHIDDPTSSLLLAIAGGQLAGLRTRDAIGSARVRGQIFAGRACAYLSAQGSDRQGLRRLTHACSPSRSPQVARGWHLARRL